jgi:membrane fusion protein, multidrug efflux system
VKKGILGAAAAIIVLVGCIAAWHLVAARSSTDRQGFTPPPVPVTPGEATVESVPIFVSGLGTVQAYMNVAVKTRVDGQITGVSFTEGQDVKTGDPLFQIDPRPFQAALTEAQANKRKDEAQLQAAQLVLDRYAKLLASRTQTQEAYDNQKATVGQLEVPSGPIRLSSTPRSSTSTMRKFARRSTGAPARAWWIPATSCRRARTPPL